MVAVRFLITGKVQGVWFRASTRDHALRLGLRGHATNLADGRVEVLAVGDGDAIEQLANWLQHGPPLARVDAMERGDAGVEADAGAGTSGVRSALNAAADTGLCEVFLTYARIEARGSHRAGHDR